MQKEEVFRKDRLSKEFMNYFFVVLLSMVTLKVPGSAKNFKILIAINNDVI